jgi:hypothetical protein
VLFVVDGGKALDKAIRAVYANKAAGVQPADELAELAHHPSGALHHLKHPIARMNSLDLQRVERVEQRDDLAFHPGEGIALIGCGRFPGRMSRPAVPAVRTHWVLLGLVEEGQQPRLAVLTDAKPPRPR